MGKKMTRKVMLKDRAVESKKAQNIKGGPIYMMPTDQYSLTFNGQTLSKLQGPALGGGNLAKP